MPRAGQKSLCFIELKNRVALYSILTCTWERLCRVREHNEPLYNPPMGRAGLISLKNAWPDLVHESFLFGSVFGVLAGFKKKGCLKLALTSNNCLLDKWICLDSTLYQDGI
jgi:hypothetical protein